MRTVALLLAAGDSERMGSPKALLDWHGQPLLSHQLQQMQKSDLSECIVVLGRDAKALEPLVRRPLRPGWKARAVINPRHADGKCSSIKVGLASLLSRPDGILIASVDQPLDHRLIDALLLAAGEEWGGSQVEGGRSILLPVYEGRRGHPPLLRGTLLAELFGVSEETQGLKTVVRRQPERVLEVPWDSADVLMNLNAPTDLAPRPEAGPRPPQA